MHSTESGGRATRIGRVAVRRPWYGLAGAAAVGVAVLAAAALPARAAANEDDRRRSIAAGDTSAAPRVEGWPFPDTERFEYAVRLGRLELGRGTIVSRPDTAMPDVHARRVSLTIDVGVAFAQIHDSHVSWLATDPLRTLRLRKRYRELGREKGGQWRLDHEAGVSVAVGTDDGSRSPMPEAALDGLGLLYLLRTMPLEPGQTIRLDRHFQPEHNPVIFRVVGRERIRVPAGRFRTVVVEPVIPALDVFGEDRDARIWLSDDGRRLIVRVESTTRVGPLQMHLREYAAGEE